MNSISIFFLFIVSLVFFSGCSIIKKPFFIKNRKKEERKEKREDKKIEKDIAKGKIDSIDIVKKDSILLFPTDTLLARNFLQLRTIDYNTFQAKAKMHYEGPDKKQNFTANFRLLKNKTIWVSISAFEIEAARAIITPDSVKWIDRINKNSFLYSYTQLQSIINLEVDFNTLQDLIIGNAIATNGVITDVKNVQDVLTTFVKGLDYTNQITFSKTDTSLKQIQLQTARSVSTSSLLISLTNYNRDNGYLFSTVRDLSIQDIKGAASLNIDFKKFEFNKEIEFPFTIPSSYTNKSEAVFEKE